MARKVERRKDQRRKASPGTYMGLERRSGEDSRRQAEILRQRRAVAQAKSLITLIVILAAALWALHHWASSPSNRRVSEELSDKFKYSGVNLIVVEGRGVCAHLEPEYRELLRQNEAKLLPLLSEIAEDYDAVTGRGITTFYVYIKGKLVRKVKL